jgi:hypothetical protein
MSDAVTKPVERFYDPLISLMYPVPKVAILPLIFAWFGLGSLSKIVVMTARWAAPGRVRAFTQSSSTISRASWLGRNGGLRKRPASHSAACAVACCRNFGITSCAMSRIDWRSQAWLGPLQSSPVMSKVSNGPTASRKAMSLSSAVLGEP